MFNWFRKKISTFDEDVNNLALQTALSVNKFSQVVESEYLCQSKLTKLDSAIFACFIIRAVCLGASRNRALAVAFSEKFVQRFLVYAKDIYAPDDIQLLQKAFNNRTSFYDRVFVSKEGINAKMKAIAEEFELIIKTNIVNDDFVEYCETSPLCILPNGLFGDMKCNIEVIGFYKALPELTSPYLEKVQKHLQN